MAITVNRTGGGSPWKSSRANVGRFRRPPTGPIASRVTFEDAPFAAMRETFDGRALAAALGGVEWRALEKGVRQTVARFRELGHG